MEQKPGRVFGNLYGLVRAFLKDFYTESKRGTLEHKKGIVIFLSFVFLCFVVLVVGLYKVSESPFFCGLCHNMKVYVDSWKASTHRQVDCIHCHYKPGFMNHLKGKWQDGQLSLVYFVTGKSPTRPHAEIDDASCLQSGCHARSDLKNQMVFKNVLFSHPSHIEQMRRQKQLRCTTCHSQIVQGAHMTVTDVECFICHFYKGKDQKAPATECKTCHFEARGDIEINKNFVFNHKTYIDRGIKCERCHTNVISGDGHIPEFACLQCHNKREILEAKYTPEFLHKNHVTDHKVECFTCHSPIKHQITGLHYKGQEADACFHCHVGGVHVEKVNMYLGKGAKLVKGERPNRMALINMDCSVCHGRPDQPGKTAGESCKDCHGDLTAGMLQRWKKALKEGKDELAKAIAAANSQAGQNASAAMKQTLKDAQHNYDLISKGNGVHNVVYALEVMEATQKALRAAGIGKAGTEQAGQPAKALKTGKDGRTEVSCMTMCHGEIADKKVKFGKVNFPHAAHIDGEASCLKCHSPYATHGKTYMKDCNSCHHGEGTGKASCRDCHRAEEAMYKGKGIKGIPETADSMYGKVSCTECHTAVKKGKKSGMADVKASCARCHEKEYSFMVDDWVASHKKLREKYSNTVVGLEKQLSDLETKEGRHSVPLRGFFDEINRDMQFVLNGRWSHNPNYGEAMLGKVDKNIQALQSMIKARQEGRHIILNK